MPKIKITKEIKEYEGTIEEKVVTPFGNSAHINVGKKHTGKILPIIIQSDPEYKWILSDIDLKEVVKECKRLLKNEKGRFKFYKVSALKNIQSGKFNMGDLVWVVSILEKSSKNILLVKRIKSTYNLHKRKI